jgi:hypothetical protein
MQQQVNQEFLIPVHSVNNAGGQIYIDRPTGTALNNAGSATVFTNAALIRIGSLATSPAYGLQNSASAVFNKYSNGEIDIDRTGVDGLNNNTSATFTNNSLLKSV